jgi:hypothetical protein
LEVERGDELEGDVATKQHRGADVRPHERARAQDPEPHERRAHSALQQHEGDQQQRGDREADQRLCVAPAVFGSGHDGADEEERRRAHRHRAADVERGSLPGGDGLIAWDQAQARDHEQRRQRTGDEERPAPADLGQQAAHDEAAREPDGGERGVDPQRFVARRALREGRRQEREAGGDREGGADALDEAGRDQDAAVVGDAAEDRGDGEHRHRGEEDLAPADDVAGASTEQQQAAVTEHVAGDDPLQFAGREAEGVADRRQRDADHRDVKVVETEGSAEHQEEAPQAG